MARKLVDISVPLENDVPADPPFFGPKISYVDHRGSVPQFLDAFPGLSKAELPDGEGWAVELVQLVTHNGTHVDAPYHYASTMDKGRRAVTIDEVPLEWFFQPAVKLDLRHLPDGDVATAADIDAELRRIHHELRPLEIVVVNTRAGSRYGSADYVNSGCGVGREIGYCQIEKLHHLEALPADGFSVSCFPVKIRGASAGWTRAVAIWEEP